MKTQYNMTVQWRESITDGALSAQAAQRSMTRGLERLVVRAKELQTTLVVHESPYPMVLAQLTKLVHKHHDDKSPLILLIKRDQKNWTTRRASTHGQQLVCKDYVNNTIQPRTLKR